jgi:hypothetical protein
MMERKTDDRLEHADSIKASYGNDIPDLTAACKYVQRLLASARVRWYRRVLQGEASFEPADMVLHLPEQSRGA